MVLKKQFRILIVEDNETYGRMLMLRLKSLGYDVILTKDGLEGYNTAKKEFPDLIILDVMIPEMDGLKVCRLLKFDIKLQHIPVIMLTCRNLAQDVKAAIHAHADAFIIKSTRSEVLIKTIEQLLSQGKD